MGVISSGISYFESLPDGPGSYLGDSLKGVRVNVGETSLEYYTITDLNTNLANTNLTLNANRTHALAGFNLIFSGSLVTDYVGFGITPTAKVHVKGYDATSIYYGLKVDNTSENLFSVRNNGEVNSKYGFWLNTDKFVHTAATTTSVFVGVNAGLSAASTASDNIAIGKDTLQTITAGTGISNVRNVAIGSSALASLLDNTFVGDAAANTAVGYVAGKNMTRGYQNTIIGSSSGSQITTEFNNTLIGRNTDIVAGARNATAIGQGSVVSADNDMIFGTSVNRVGMGGITSVNTSSLLELSSTSKGFLPPRMTATQGSAITKVDGLIVYVTNTDATFTSLGLWCVENNVWVKL